MTATALLNTQTPDAAVPVITFGSNTLDRDGGSWISDGFAVGQAIVVSNTTGNDGMYRISAITATRLTITTVGGTPATLVPGNTSGSTVDVQVSTNASLLHPNLTFFGSTLSRDRGSWTTDGFKVGDAREGERRRHRQRWAVPDRRDLGRRPHADPHAERGGNR